MTRATSETELQTAEKLTKSNKYYIVFPHDGLINERKRLTKESGKKRNDIFIIPIVAKRPALVTSVPSNGRSDVVRNTQIRILFFKTD